MKHCFGIQVLTVALLLQAGCHRPANSTVQTKPLLTDKEVIAIADKEIKRRGLDKKYGFDFDEIDKVSSMVYIYVFFADDSCYFFLDENDGIIDNTCEHPDMYSLMKGSSLISLRNKEDVILYFTDMLKRYMPDKTVNHIYCQYYQ